MIDADRVEKIFFDCLFRQDEVKDGKPTVEPVKGLGIKMDFGFHPDHLKQHTDEIVAFLKELPDKFHKNKGGGWSFLNACDTQEGQQWTGLHERMEQLFALGNALGKVSFPLPKSMWNTLPGGMPYVTINL